MPARDELATLRAENARLITLLESHGIEWHQPQTVSPVPVAHASEPSRLSPAEKVALFRRLFRGRADVYPSSGRARPQVSLAIHRPVQTNGVPAYARSAASSAETVATAC